MTIEKTFSALLNIKNSKDPTKGQKGNNQFTDRESQGLSTLDGFILSEQDKAFAIKNGVGVVVGDYFVGHTAGPELVPPSPVNKH